MKVLKNEPLKKHTSFRVGGPAKVYVIPEDDYELRKLIEFLYEEKLPYKIIGNGTNLLVSDEGVDTIVVEIGKALEGIELIPDANVYLLKVMAGTLIGKAAQFAADNSLAGMEALRGIPGTVGGAVTMNAGAYGTEMIDVLKSVDVITKEGKLLTLTPGELKLGYRYSIVPEKEYVVVSATFALKKGDKKEINALMADYQQRRKDKQPIDKASAGSTFKRPEGHFAGKLIEDCGLRGYKHGGAMVSEKHCGFVINDGTARAADIYWLIGEIRKRVLLEQGVELTPEVKIWGNF
ncbi:MAG: UDP-N-acetylmuramate dehydrogenase [Oribacterium sp.]|nr:UDP-N-acetylmuramate dehydrogenase [Oribacterium sp.]